MRLEFAEENEGEGDLPRATDGPAMAEKGGRARETVIGVESSLSEAGSSSMLSRELFSRSWS